MKKIIISIAVLVIIVIGVVYFKDTKNTSDSVLNEQTSQNNEQSEVSSIPQNSSSTTPSTLKSITKAEIAKHNKPADCWTTINGKVYDLTAFVTKHPGGDKAIFSICGIDGSKAFNNQHGGQEQPETTLKGFDIGTLVQ